LAKQGNTEGKYPFYSSSSEFTKFTDEYDYKGNCMIFGTGGNASIHFQEGSFSTSTDCIVAKIKNEKEVFAKYVYLYFKSNMNILKSGFKGAGLKHISKGYISNIQIPLPPIDDQIRIADILSRAESLIAKRKETIKMLDEYLKSVFLDMFGDRNYLSKQKKNKLGDYILFLTSGSRGWAKYYSEAGSVFLRINNVRDAYLKLEDMMYVNPPDTAETIRTKVKKNDLLLSITADLGRTAVVPQNLEGAYINQHLAIIRLDNKRINPLFAAWFYAMPYGRSIVMRKNRNAVKAGLNFDDIKDFDIISPPLKQQNEFANIVDKMQGIKRRYADNMLFLEQLNKTLSTKMFSASK
jgi:type I restriction enzyme S subunit